VHRSSSGTPPAHHRPACSPDRANWCRLSSRSRYRPYRQSKRPESQVRPAERERGIFLGVGFVASCGCESRKLTSRYRILPKGKAAHADIVHRTLIFFAAGFVFRAAHSEPATRQNNHYWTLAARSEGIAMCLSWDEDGAVSVRFVGPAFLRRHFPIAVRLGVQRRDHEIGRDREGESSVP